MKTSLNKEENIVAINEKNNNQNENETESLYRLTMASIQTDELSDKYSELNILSTLSENKDRNNISFVNVDNDIENKKKKNQPHLSVIKFLSIPTTGIIIGGIIGIILGILLARLQVSNTISKWILLPGELFIRILKCLIIPLIFSSLTSGIADIASVGKASTITKKMMIIFLFATLIASTFGVLLSRLFYNNLYKSSKNITSMSTLMHTIPFINIQCNNGKYLEYIDTNTTLNQYLNCSGESASSNNSIFILKDINSYYQKTTKPSSKTSLPLLTLNFINNFVPLNIVEAFVSASYLSIVSFSIIFGLALRETIKQKRKREMKKMKKLKKEKDYYTNHNNDNNERLYSNETKYRKDLILELLRQFTDTMNYLVNLIIKFVPVAIMSLTCGLHGSKEIMEPSNLKHMIYLSISLFLTSFIYIYIILPIIYYIYIKQNPYIYLYKMIPTQVFALGSASSLSALPVTIECVDKTKEMSPYVSRFVIVLGTPLNMNGTAIYLPIAINFLIQTSGLSDQMTIGKWILLIFISSITAIGGAPVPNAALVMIYTVWNTLLTQDVPITFSFLVAMDWILDRIRTVTNVSGNTIAARLVAEKL